MNQEPPQAFDEFASPGTNTSPTPSSKKPNAVSTGLRTLSSIALALAALSVAIVIGAHLYRLLTAAPASPAWVPKSAVPLIAIGLSYLALIFTVDRTPAQRLLGILVSLAFILWGVEQYLPDPGIVSVIDDIVVLIFVLDLGIVIRENLARSRREQSEKQRASAEKPPQT